MSRPAMRTAARLIYLQTGWPFTTDMLFPCGHPFGCGGATFGAGAGGGLAAAAAGVTGFALAGGVTGFAAGRCGGVGEVAPGGGDEGAIAGFVGAVTNDGGA